MNPACVQPGKCGFQRLPVEQRFWQKVEKTDGCWLWNAWITPAGYGYFWNGERNIHAHRVAYELLRGPIPDGLEIDHLCRNRPCVNPAHLETVTHAENMRRVDRSGLGWRRHTTHCLRGHPYSPQNTKVLPDGARVCLACKALREERRIQRLSHKGRGK